MKSINRHYLSALIILLICGSFANAQVKIGVNPTQIVSGAKLQVDGDNTTSTAAKLIVTGTGNVGVGTANPGTTLDINGAITNREVDVTVSSNAVTVPANTSMVKILGIATASISINVPAAPNAGQRLVIYNNSTGGFTSILNSINIPNGKAHEFVYSNGNWQSISTPSATVIIPYASSAPVTLTTVVGGLAGTGAILGFGTSLSGISVTAASIDITGGSGLNLNFGFAVPRDGTIRSLTAFFSSTSSLSLLGTNLTVKAQLYRSNSIISNFFTPVSGAEVFLSPSLTGTINVGSTCSGITSDLSIPVTAQYRYLLVFTTTATGLSLINSINGYASAGLAIE